MNSWQLFVESGDRIQIVLHIVAVCYMYLLFPWLVNKEFRCINSVIVVEYTHQNEYDYGDGQNEECCTLFVEFHSISTIMAVSCGSSVRKLQLTAINKGMEL